MVPVDRVIHGTWVDVDIRPLLVAGWFALSGLLLLLPVTIALLAMPHDWFIWEQVPQRWAEGRLYEPDHPWYFFVFSPIAGAIMAAVVPLGYALWWALHLAVLPLLRDWRLVALTVLSVPFWIDTMVASTVTWPFVAGVLALRGSKWGALAYLALFALMPRPVHLPLAAWIVWQRPELRLPALGMAVVTLAVTLWTGYLDDWTANLLWSGSDYLTVAHNFSPTRLVGGAWLIVGVPLAAWLTWRGRVGLAGLAMTPYLLPPYFLMLLWELTNPKPTSEQPRQA